ncbi:MAG: ABC transporter ATP-binding protein [Chitinophagales bacterium]|nr:ABC transporter ATP-binding protein [Bacteroidota bacterium]MCB9257635.1 ABC transporter ATP-binding protein [Chitinophagales bacterium]
MSEVVLKVSNVSKLYRLGEVGTGTISHDLNRWWAKLMGKEDPFAKVGQVNDRSKSSKSDYVWAIKGINFEVKKGEILGIIGKNGAGKSTLLKILSQITSPTTGSIKAKGRVASLLEVGTGMHPEMTARENIYLNGAILGMTKKEINDKFDEIIEFSGCIMYVDTPIKRFSSGMRVRLGFAVAAFLEPEILIVDEVLAVGDAEFQRKAIGKMKEVSQGEGRTVLFVSHNMAAVQSLCTRAIVLNNGEVSFEGTTEMAIDEYSKMSLSEVNNKVHYSLDEAPGNEFIALKNIETTSTQIKLSDSIKVHFSFWNKLDLEEVLLCFDLTNAQEQTVFSTATSVKHFQDKVGSATCEIPSNFLNDDLYSVTLFFFDKNMRRLYNKPDIIQFEVVDLERELSYFGKVSGVVRPILKWS